MEQSEVQTTIPAYLANRAELARSFAQLAADPKVSDRFMQTAVNLLEAAHEWSDAMWKRGDHVHL